MSLGVPELLIVLLIVALLFGTRKLRSIGNDLGNAVKGFRAAVNEENGEAHGDKPAAGKDDAARPD